MNIGIFDDMRLNNKASFGKLFVVIIVDQFIL